MKVVVFDDDPTGSQTVHSCPLILKWDYQTLAKAIEFDSPLIFILSNTRSMSPNHAEARLREIISSFLEVIKDLNFQKEEFIFVSRGDSTLRGHGFMEPKLINELLGPFDATFHIPAFLEGARTTVNGIHLLNGKPVHQSPFAKDKIFGYATSDLRMWLEKISEGIIDSNNVGHISLDVLNNALSSSSGMDRLMDLLLDLSGNKSLVVDSSKPEHLTIFATAIRKLKGKKTFLFRSAASFISSLVEIRPNTSLLSEIRGLRLLDKLGNLKPGLIMIGSYVPLADKQIKYLLEQDNCAGIEVPVEVVFRLAKESLSKDLLADLSDQLYKQLQSILSEHKTPVLYTTRGEFNFVSLEEKIDFGIFLAEFMSSLAVRIKNRLGYVISKGGVTTNTLLSDGLKLQYVFLKGQIIPGLSLVLPPKESDSNQMPIVTFPGNFGNEKTLLEVWQLMELI